VYLPQEKIGVRIEDDIFITARGPVTLTRDIPRSSKEIEAAMALARMATKVKK
jgi:Xaa-Pro aminopeptidase